MLNFTINNLQLFTMRIDSIWSLLLINLNLKLEECFKKHNLLLYNIILYLNNLKDIHSFLKFIVEKLKAFTIEIENVYNVYIEKIFIIQSHLIFVNVNLFAITKMMKIFEHDSYNHCRFCMIQGIHSFNHIYYSLRTSEDWPENIAFHHNPTHLSLRDNAIYKRIAAETLSYEAFNPQTRDRSEYRVV